MVVDGGIPAGMGWEDSISPSVSMLLARAYSSWHEPILRQVHLERRRTREGEKRPNHWHSTINFAVMHKLPYSGEHQSQDRTCRAKSDEVIDKLRTRCLVHLLASAVPSVEQSHGRNRGVRGRGLEVPANTQPLTKPLSRWRSMVVWARWQPRRSFRQSRRCSAPTLRSTHHGVATRVGCCPGPALQWSSERRVQSVVNEAANCELSWCPPRKVEGLSLQ